MGANSTKITKIKYDKIKAECQKLRERGLLVGVVDELVMAKFNISQTTARWIRNTGNYDIYRLKTAKGRSQIRYEQDRRAYKEMMARRAAPKESYAANVVLLALFGIILLAVVVSLAIVIIKVLGASR